MKLVKENTYGISASGILMRFDATQDAIKDEREEARKRWQELKARDVMGNIAKDDFKPLMRFLTWLRNA